MAKAKDIGAIKATAEELQPLAEFANELTNLFDPVVGFQSPQLDGNTDPAWIRREIDWRIGRLKDKINFKIAHFLETPVHTFELSKAENPQERAIEDNKHINALVETICRQENIPVPRLLPRELGQIENFNSITIDIPPSNHGLLSQRLKSLFPKAPGIQLNDRSVYFDFNEADTEQAGKLLAQVANQLVGYKAIGELQASIQSTSGFLTKAEDFSIPVERFAVTSKWKEDLGKISQHFGLPSRERSAVPA